MQIELLEYAKRHKRLYCYGAGHFGKVIRIFLDEHGITLNGFIVSTRQTRENVLDVPVFGIDDALKESDSGIFVGVGIKFRDEIVAELESRGYSDYFVLEESYLRKIEQQITFKNNYTTEGFISVLYYHRICNLARDTWQLAVSSDLFEEHVRFLKKHYKILRFEDDWQDIREKSIVITFDDGYADNFENALPILERYEVPATFFVCTEPNREFWWDKLDRILFATEGKTQEVFWANRHLPIRTDEEKIAACYALHPYFKALLPEKREKALSILTDNLSVSASQPSNENRLLSEQEIKALSASPYVTLGGHTVTHTALAIEPQMMQFKEIKDSKASLESVTGQSLSVFSYPFGGENDFTEETKNDVRKCGYEKAATTIPGLADTEEDSFMIPRNWIPGNCNLYQLKRILGQAWYL